ncbi:hypothetical protein BGY98DRAFT_1179155 [Russula aff. rugulosa BPL654]|nr:hypothetical protein BGY98DRAFT_1179155 [Russula aff. rugulosa BPL654]
MAHYSSLFTLGLLSDRASPPSSPKTNMFYKFRKSSLPTKSVSKPSLEFYAASPSDAPPQFTNPFDASSPVSEASTELRSFLSLDLAADKNLSSSRLLLPLDRAALNSTNLSPLQPVPSSSRSAPQSIIARRPSRDSLRTLPSPRPAPSSALPNLPSQRKDSRAPPPILIPNLSLFPPASSSSRRGSPTSHHPPLSAPPVNGRSPSLTSNHGFPTPSPVSPLSSPSFRRTRQESFMSFSPVSTVTSSRTVRRRNVERSNALACLEGRSRAPGRVPRRARQRNFMSMSDDDEENRDDDTGGDADVEDDSDAPEQPHTTTSMSSFVLSPPPPSPSRSTRLRARLPIDEEEDRVLPPPASNFHTHVQQKRASSSSSVSKPKSRRSTLESWFPLANFIDLKDDDLQGWRGVVEIVNGL